MRESIDQIQDRYQYAGVMKDKTINAEKRVDRHHGETTNNEISLNKE
jgi:hypothetical protein